MTSEEIQQAIEKLDNLWKTSQTHEAKEFAYELFENPAIQEDSESLAKVYNILGNVYKDLSDYSKALEYYSKAIHVNEEIGNKERIGIYLGNIGLVYFDLSDYPKALEYHSKSLQIDEELENKNGISRHLGNIGNVYLYLSDYPKALEYYSKALQINEEIRRKIGIASNLVNIGNVYAEHSDYPKVLEYSTKALQIFEEIGNKNGIAVSLGNIGSVYYKLSDYPKALEYYEKALIFSKKIGDKRGIATKLLNIGGVYRTKESTFYDSKKAEEYLQKSLLLAEEIGSKDLIGYVYENLHKLRQNEGQFEEALEFYKKSVEIEKEIQSEDTKNKAQKFDQLRKIEEDEKARQLKLARFQEQEKILHNILPVKIADRILNQEPFIADHFDSVSVLFMDLVGFTSLASIAPPKQLVYFLDAIFQKADEVVESYGLEKIKTIGDGYLAVANVTSPLENHQKATALAALQLLETMQEFTVNIPSDLGDTTWIKEMKDIEIRIGIHTGEVVAGIIGKNKYTYDLWGDAVNIASRMESHSESGRIHISEQFAISIENYEEFEVIPRGEITIKGKGSMNTFWLEKGK